ncbi:MAG TPA: hypothetical protein VMW28_09280, partial [Pelolinea sp.]|nr:hypothetical protein [Pelolinea sp.]
MAYLDLLDSVKTAHPQSYSLEWWHPQSEIDQMAAIAIAQSSIMIQILMGETISLANNQIVDSCAWFSLAEKMCELDEILPWAPFKFVYFEQSNPPVSSMTLKKLVLDCFNREDYGFSAWINLDKGQKKQIISNIGAGKPHFNNMLKGLSHYLDKNLEDKLQEQAFGLQRVYEYLSKWEKSRNVCISAYTSKKRLWPRIESLRDIPNGIRGSIIDDIRTTIGDDKLELRGAIYLALKDIDIENQERESLQKKIDLFYNEKLLDSVSRGRGELTMIDHTPDKSLKQDFIEYGIADKENGHFGLINNSVYDVRLKN